MFGFGKNYKEQADIVGSILHEQIYSAMKENEPLASERLRSPFFLGYFVGFVKGGLVNSLNVPSDKTRKYYEYICDGIHPKTLFNTINKITSTVQATKEIFEEDYISGTKVGLYDGNNFLKWDDSSKRNLKSYLLKQKLYYEDEGAMKSEYIHFGY